MRKVLVAVLRNWQWLIVFAWITWASRFLIGLENEVSFASFRVDSISQQLSDDNKRPTRNRKPVTIYTRVRDIESSVDNLQSMVDEVYRRLD